MSNIVHYIVSKWDVWVHRLNYVRATSVPTETLQITMSFLASQRRNCWHRKSISVCVPYSTVPIETSCLTNYCCFPVRSLSRAETHGSRYTKGVVSYSSLSLPHIRNLANKPHFVFSGEIYTVQQRTCLVFTGVFIVGATCSSDTCLGK